MPLITNTPTRCSQLRLVVDATVRTAASPETLHRLADGVRALTGQLIGRRCG
jgi:hypothetical protein